MSNQNNLTLGETMVTYVYDSNNRIDVNGTIDRMTKDDRKMRRFIEEKIEECRYRPALDLDDIEELTPYGATLVAKYKEKGTVYLNGLEQCTWQSLAILAKVKARTLDLNGLKSIEELEARAISHFRGIALSLNGLMRIDEDSAIEIAQFDGRALFLDGIKGLWPAEARNLCKFGGKEIFLRGLRFISLEVTKAFLAFPGKIHI